MLPIHSFFRPMLAALVIVGCAAAPAFAAANFSASRTSGVAPLLVVFDATSTTAASAGDPFHEVYFHWSFSDSGSGNWAHTGSSRNEAHGPIAAHVFQKPGTYSVRLNTLDPNGATSTKSVTISVSDPNTVFSGTKTICVSASGNFSGCPSGAAHVTTSTFTSAVGHAAPGRRVLLRRGDSFTGRAVLNGNGPGILGAYGSGASPKVTFTGSNAALIVSTAGVLLKDWRVMDIAFVGAGTQYSSAIAADAYLEQFLVLRVQSTLMHTGISINPRKVNRDGLPHIHDQVGVVDSVFENMDGGSGGAGMYIAASHLAILGNTVRDSTRSEHLIRLPYVGQSVLSHNLLQEPAIKKHHLKLHATEVTSNFSYAERDSHEVVISENIAEGGINGWSFTLGPQNGIVDERIRQMIVERNRFTTGSGTRTHMLIWGRDLTARNNVYETGASFVSVGQRGIEPPPSNVQVYDNCLLPLACGSFAGGGTAPSGGGGGTSTPTPTPSPTPSMAPPAAPVLLP